VYFESHPRAEYIFSKHFLLVFGYRFISFIKEKEKASPFAADCYC